MRIGYASYVDRDTPLARPEPTPPPFMCYCQIYDVAKGLEYIHALGMLHGGLQGSNVLIALDGSAVLSDFSLSKMMDPGAMFTQSNGPSASLRWMSPEAHNAEFLSAQSDVYSWGMTTLQILSLREFSHTPTLHFL